MIVGNLKPVEEIAASVAGLKNVLVVGCGSCVTVCLSGGDREARQLADELSLPLYYPDAPPPAFAVNGIVRQCEKDLVKTYLTVPPETDAVISLACGAGVQTIADVFSPLPVFPALNTTFLGAMDEPGVWREKCHGCGDCVLSFTGSICPVARCAKSLFNGPCGGSQGGSCEVNPEIPCAWAMIYYRLKSQNRLDFLRKVRSSRDWRPAGNTGPRSRIRTGIAGSPGDSLTPSDRTP